MGLLADKIEVNLYGKNISWYESKGYSLPKAKNAWGKIVVPKGSKITVDVKDIHPGAHFRIEYECDLCGKHIWTPAENITDRYTKDGKMYCAACTSSLFFSGKNNPRWKPEKTDEERINGRSYPEYHELIRRVMARANYSCEITGEHGVALEVHHLNSYDWCVEGRLDEQNCVCISEQLHSAFHDIYGRGNNTREQFEEWLGFSLGDLGKFFGEIPLSKKVVCMDDKRIFNSTKEAAGFYHIRAADVSEVCRRRDSCRSTHGHHFLYLSDFEKMTEEDVAAYWRWTKVKNNIPVVRMNDGTVYDSMSIAVKENPTANVHGISDCCKGKLKHSGKSIDGVNLRWCYFTDYLLA